MRRNLVCQFAHHYNIFFCEGENGNSYFELENKTTKEFVSEVFPDEVPENKEVGLELLYRKRERRYVNVVSSTGEITVRIEEPETTYDKKLVEAAEKDLIIPSWNSEPSW